MDILAGGFVTHADDVFVVTYPRAGTTWTAQIVHLMYGSYSGYVLPWWQASRNAANILFLKYEDMKRDLAGVVGQIAGFIDVAVYQPLLERVVAGSSFQAMTANEKTNFSNVEGVPMI